MLLFVATCMYTTGRLTKIAGSVDWPQAHRCQQGRMTARIHLVRGGSHAYRKIQLPGTFSEHVFAALSSRYLLLTLTSSCTLHR